MTLVATTTEYLQKEEVNFTTKLFHRSTTDLFDGDEFAGESMGSTATLTSTPDLQGLNLDESSEREWNNVGWKNFNFATGEMEFEVPFLLAVALCGVLGNALVLAVYLQKKYRKSNAALYMLNLAIGDLFILLIVVVFHITEFFPQTWPYLWRHHAQCWLHRFGRFFGFNSTMFTSVAVAYDRFLAIVYPLQFKVKCTAKRTMRNIMISWITAFFTAILGAWNFRAKFQEDGYYENYRGKSPFACWVLDLGKVFNDFKIIYMSILLFFIPVVITMIFYVLIIGFMWRNNQVMKGMTAQAKARRTQWKTARVLLIVFIAYVSCFILFATYTVVQQLFLYEVKPMVKNVGLLMPYANSCMNPTVYSLTNERFREAVWEMCGCASKSKKAVSRQNKVKVESKNTDKSGDNLGQNKSTNIRSSNALAPAASSSRCTPDSGLSSQGLSNYRSDKPLGTFKDDGKREGKGISKTQTAAKTNGSVDRKDNDTKSKENSNPATNNPIFGGVYMASEDTPLDNNDLHVDENSTFYHVYNTTAEDKKEQTASAQENAGFKSDGDDKVAEEKDLCDTEERAYSGFDDKVAEESDLCKPVECTYATSDADEAHFIPV